MKAEFVNPFVESAVTVFKDMCGFSVSKGQLSIKKSNIDTLGVAPIIGVTGDVSGRVIYDMSIQTALKISSIMNGEELKEFDDLAQSTISELSNIITGNTISLLSSAGFHVDITPPTLFLGKDMHISKGEMLTLVVPLQTDAGEIFINVALKENKK
ncbi:chemotaxis protein CheX [Candidatus Dependentiae bacterium]|nr:chemotaxis protein CheX [Candidatus Dependentiae bacterium]